MHTKLNKNKLAASSQGTGSVYVGNQLRHRALFDSCAVRRQGYRALVTPDDLISLCSPTLTPERENAMRVAWEVGALWPMPILVADVVESEFCARKWRNLDIAVFLKPKRKVMPIQILESPDCQASKEHLELLTKGLYNKKGQRIEVFNVQAVY